MSILKGPLVSLLLTVAPMTAFELSRSTDCVPFLKATKKTVRLPKAVCSSYLPSLKRRKVRVEGLQDILENADA